MTLNIPRPVPGKTRPPGAFRQSRVASPPPFVTLCQSQSFPKLRELSIAFRQADFVLRHCVRRRVRCYIHLTIKTILDGWGICKMSSVMSPPMASPVVTSANPMVTPANEVFERDGCLTLNSLTTPADIDLIRSLLDPLFDKFDTLGDRAVDLAGPREAGVPMRTPEIN